MKARWFILGLVPLLASGGLAADQSPKPARVGILLVGSPDFPTLRGLVDGLKEAGYVEGKNLVLDMGIKAGYDELHSVAKTYRKKKIDVIVAFGETTTSIVKETIQEVPIVFIHTIDPIGAGFVKSLARPGARLTGLMSYTGYEMQAKRLELFKEIVPALQRVTVLYNARAGSPHQVKNLEVVRGAAPKLKLTSSERGVQSTLEAEQAASSLSRAHTDGIFLICSFLFEEAFRKIAAVAREKKLPLNGCNIPQIADQGGLWTYAPDIYLLGYRGAWYVDRILKGAKPQDLPVETPTHFDLTINLRTAKEIGLKIPPEVLIRTDKIIH